MLAKKPGFFKETSIFAKKARYMSLCDFVVQLWRPLRSLLYFVELQVCLVEYLAEEESSSVLGNTGEITSLTMMDEDI
jgi:hypothetical protein